MLWIRFRRRNLLSERAARSQPRGRRTTGRRSRLVQIGQFGADRESLARGRPGLHLEGPRTALRRGRHGRKTTGRPRATRLEQKRVAADPLEASPPQDGTSLPSRNGRSPRTGDGRLSGNPLARGSRRRAVHFPRRRRMLDRRRRRGCALSLFRISGGRSGQDPRARRRAARRLGTRVRAGPDRIARERVDRERIGRDQGGQVQRGRSAARVVWQDRSRPAAGSRARAGHGRAASRVAQADGLTDREAARDAARPTRRAGHRGPSHRAGKALKASGPAARIRGPSAGAARAGSRRQTLLVRLRAARAGPLLRENVPSRRLAGSQKLDSKASPGVRELSGLDQGQEARSLEAGGLSDSPTARSHRAPKAQ